MKNYVLRFKTLAFALVAFILPVLAMAQIPVKQSCPNSMVGCWAPGPCVQLDADDNLYISLTVYVSSSTVAYHPPIRFKYSFQSPSNPSPIFSVTPAVTDAMLVPVTMNGHPVYKAIFNVQYDCNPACAASGGQFDFQLSYQLVTPDPVNTGNFIPYQIGQYPALWPPILYNIPGPGYSDVVSNASKAICCNGNNQNLPLIGNSVDNEAQFNAISIGVNPDNIMAKTGFVKDGLLVSPNPFRADLWVRCNILNPGLVKFECLDAQGKLVKAIAQDFQVAGNQSLHLDLGGILPGLYYLRMVNDEGAQVVKLVKE